MEAYKQLNWIGQGSLNVRLSPATETSKETVCLSMSIGPMSFCEHLTKTQAIDFAAALVRCAMHDAQTMTADDVMKYLSKSVGRAEA